MKHASSLDVFTHWNERRGNSPAPLRSDIDPAAIRHSLGDVFMLAVDFSSEYRFRLAGTRICALFGREIKGESFTALWSEPSRPPIEALLRAMHEDKTGAVAGITGSTADGTALELELALLPLSSVGHARIRALGVLAATHTPFWIGVKPLTKLSTGAIRHLNGDARTLSPQFMPTAGTRLRHGFVVVDGGKTDHSHEKAS